MESVPAQHRKLIDLKPAVFDSLSFEAKRQGMSLKKYIETLLENACPPKSAGKTSGIYRLVGSALPGEGDLAAIDDDRLQYLLSK